MRGPFIGCATGARRGADEPLEGVRKASRRGNKDCRGPSVVAPRLASTAKAGQTASSRGKPAQAEFGPMYRARLFQLSQKRRRPFVVEFTESRSFRKKAANNQSPARWRSKAPTPSTTLACRGDGHRPVLDRG